MDVYPALSLQELRTWIGRGKWLLSRDVPDEPAPIRKAFENFGAVQADLLGLFQRYAELANENTMRIPQFYRGASQFNERQRLEAKWQAVINLLSDLALEATRAGNHLMSLARQEIDTGLLSDVGWLLAPGAQKADLSYDVYRVRYVMEHESYPGLRDFVTQRHTRDSCFGKPDEDELLLVELDDT